MNLYEMTSEFKEAERSLNEMLYSEEIDEQTVTDTLDSLMLGIEEKAVNTVKYVKNLEATAQAIKAEEQAMKARRQRLEKQADRLKEYVKSAMVSTGSTKIHSPWFVLSLRKSPASVIIEDENAITGEWKEVHQVVKIKKNDIKAALKAGGVVAGARLESGQTLSIK